MITKKIERRKEPRVSLKGPKAVLCTIRRKTEKDSIEGRILDISAGGVCLETGHLLDSGDILELSFLDKTSYEEILVGMKIVTPFRLSVLHRLFNFIQSKISVFFKIEPKYKYHCQRCYDLVSSPAFDQFYERVLSDYYVAHLNEASEEAPAHSHRSHIFKQKIQYKIAETAKEREAAYRLIYREYLERNFVTPNQYEMFTSVYQLLPEATTYIGVLNGKVVATISGVIDSPMKLPADKLFNDILEPMRSPERRFMEFTMLATRRELFGKHTFSLKHYNKMAALFSLFRLAMQHSYFKKQVTDVFISINPRYQKLYQYLCFEAKSEKRSYAEFNNQPAVAYHLDMCRVMEKEFRKDLHHDCLFTFFFMKRLPESVLSPAPIWTKNDFEYLFREKSDLLSKLSPAFLSTLGLGLVP